MLISKPAGSGGGALSQDLTKTTFTRVYWTFAHVMLYGVCGRGLEHVLVMVITVKVQKGQGFPQPKFQTGCLIIFIGI